MRSFVLFARQARTDAQFQLDNLPGAGRMDLVARCVQSALWLSKDIRRDSRIYLVLNGPPSPPKTILFDGAELRNVSPDERSIGLWLKKTLLSSSSAEWSEFSAGISIANKSFQEIVRELKKNKIYVLHEKGKDIRIFPLERDAVFILGDNIGLPLNEEKYCLRYGEKINVGPKSYLASQCIVLVHNELDRLTK